MDPAITWCIQENFEAYIDLLVGFQTSSLSVNGPKFDNTW